jgi:hypothetical protein
MQMLHEHLCCGAVFSYLNFFKLQQQKIDNCATAKRPRSDRSHLLSFNNI